MDMSQYHDLFLTETREHLKKISALTLALEADHGAKSIIDDLFRSVHSIKGMAASMGFDRAAEVAHKLEDLMDRIRKGQSVDAGLFDLLLAGEAALTAMVDDIAGGGSGNLDCTPLLESIRAYQENPAVVIPDQQKTSTPPEEAPAPAVRGESISQQTVPVKTTVLDHLLDTTGELITVKHHLTELARTSGNHEFSTALLGLEKYLRELQDQVMAVRLMPLSLITERFPRMIRDLARSSGKEVIFSIKGAEIELDRSILDRIGDPLSHLLRNSVDHGIEPPQERLARGKPASGRISIAIVRDKDQVELRIEDDGKGMDPDTIAAAAVARGVLSKERLAALSAEEKLLLICHPGFSTADKVSEISGRGVGMDVVRTALQNMGGSLSILSKSGAGSSFLLRLPLTLAIIHVLLVKSGRLTLAIPLTAVERTMELKCADLATVEGQEVFFLDDEMLPVVPLSRILLLPAAAPLGEMRQVFITVIKGQKIALQVDQILGNQEVFVKTLPRPLSAIKGINGATLLGNGEIIFVLDNLNKF